MGRRLRPHLPGTPFHVTARLQGRAAWFTEIEQAVVRRILHAPRRSDADLLAYAVMPNHLHMVVVQGRQPLSQFMQPLLRRVALLVQRCTGHDGHVFERRFRASPCLDAEYFRNAIVYVHLNALRANLCLSPDAYEWCSHAAYAAPGARECTRNGISVGRALWVFAARGEDTLIRCQTNYRLFMDWRRATDAHRAAEENGLHAGLPPVRPSTAGGDAHWNSNYSSIRILDEAGSRPRQDLPEIARGTLSELAPEMELEVLRAGYRTKAVVRVRRRFILRALGAGHRGGVIARFLNIAPTTVSSVRTTAMQEGR
ncbi:MAG TPA: transposase [Longimicrobiales bacterium]|nr:transposase [Longimicrobiales bacterium]